MALPKLNPIDLHTLNHWFANIVDTINYDLGKIEGAVPTLDKILTNVDTAPIQYLKESLNELVDKINEGFEQFDSRLRKLESQGNQGG